MSDNVVPQPPELNAALSWTHDDLTKPGEPKARKRARGCKGHLGKSGRICLYRNLYDANRSESI
jgi:hypothetical protein